MTINEKFASNELKSVCVFIKAIFNFFDNTQISRIVQEQKERCETNDICEGEII